MTPIPDSRFPIPDTVRLTSLDWIIVAVSIVVSFIPFLVVSTVFQLPRPTLRAAIFLALMLAILGVLSPRRRPSVLPVFRSS